MKNTYNTAMSVGEIVSILPDASEVFKQYNIDFCCGGNRSLTEVIRKQHLIEKEIVEKLNRVYEESRNKTDAKDDFRSMSMNRLIDYIIGTHHAYLKKELPQISELVTKILHVHGVHHGKVLMQVHRLFHTLKTELEQHLFKEENILFPMIRKYEENPSGELLKSVMQVMKETEDEHESAGDILKELRRITENYSVPESGCTTYRLTFRKLNELESDLFQHIHLENNILFVRLEQNQ